MGAIGGDRQVLGPADVTDEQLGAMVAAQVGARSDRTEVLTAVAEPVTYELDAITTAGRYWVRGDARADGVPTSYRFFVKVVQSWARSPLFASVPAEMRDEAAASVPWRTEPLVYGSDLRERLPTGLTMPRAYGVFALDEASASVWLDVIPPPATVVAWDRERFRRAGHLLGRLAASPAVAARADVGEHDWHVGRYYTGRLVHQVLPMLRADEIWNHPLVAAAYDADLRARLRAAADTTAEAIEELRAVPVLPGHGDACPNNLLPDPRDPDGFVLIDFGFWGPLPAGFDLGQLLVGDIQIGNRRAAELASIDDAIVAAYLEGLAAEGCTIGPDVVRRAHALQLLLFTGLSTIPFEHLHRPPTPDLHALAADRAALSRFTLDLAGV